MERGRPRLRHELTARVRVSQISPQTPLPTPDAGGTGTLAGTGRAGSPSYRA